MIKILDIDRLLVQQRISAFQQHQRIMEMMVTYNYKDDRIHWTWKMWFFNTWKINWQYLIELSTGLFICRQNFWTTYIYGCRTCTIFILKEFHWFVHPDYKIRLRIWKQTRLQFFDSKCTAGLHLPVLDNNLRTDKCKIHFRFSMCKWCKIIKEMNCWNMAENRFKWQCNIIISILSLR